MLCSRLGMPAAGHVSARRGPFTTATSCVRHTYMFSVPRAPHPDSRLASSHLYLPAARNGRSRSVRLCSAAQDASAAAPSAPGVPVSEEEAETAVRVGWDPEGLFSSSSTSDTDPSSSGVSWLDRQQQRRRQQQLQQLQQQAVTAAASATATAAPGPHPPPATTATQPAAAAATPAPVATPPQQQYGAEELAAALDLVRSRHVPVDPSHPGLQLLHADPPVLLVESFMSVEQCDEWMAAAEEAGCLAASKVGAGNVNSSGGSAALTSRRTSSSALLEPKLLGRVPRLAPLVADLHRKAYRLLEAGDGSSWAVSGRLPAAGQYGFESPQVARYTPGQYFLSHEDAFPGPTAASNAFQRHATLLVYLNDVKQGGSTVFDLLGPLAVQPRKGCALLFFPSFADGAPDARTLHTATPPNASTKWVVQQWIVRGWQPALHPPPPRPAAAAAALPSGGAPQQPMASKLPPVMKVSVKGGSSKAAGGSGSSGKKAGGKKKGGGGGGGSKRGFGG